MEEKITGINKSLTELNTKINEIVTDNSCVVFYDGTIDFDNEEQVAEIEENLAVGKIVASNCCKTETPADEAVYINGLYNTKEIIDESGDWIAPVTGWYRITCIGGGGGANIHVNGTVADYGSAGNTGGFKKEIRFYNKGQVIPVTIGAGGSKAISYQGQSGNSTLGGITVFDDIETPQFGGFDFNGINLNVQSVITNVWNTKSLMATGQGFGGGYHYNAGSGTEAVDGHYWGAGGGAILDNVPVSAEVPYTDPELYKLMDAYQGCVRLRYYNPDKTNLFIREVVD